MAVDKFKFVSPGVFIDEIDNSELPRLAAGRGPVIIGRTEKGPALRPTIVESFSDFVEVFGAPIAGGVGDDVWRNGNYTAPTYAAYAAQAWLKNNSPATIVRLLGASHPEADTTTSKGEAGWKTTNTLNSGSATGGGAFGLFLIPKDYGVGIGKPARMLSGSGGVADDGTVISFEPTGPGGHQGESTGMPFQLMSASSPTSQMYNAEEPSADGVINDTNGVWIDVTVPTHMGGYANDQKVKIRVTGSSTTGGAGEAASQGAYEIFISASSAAAFGHAVMAAVNGQASADTFDGATNTYAVSYGSSVGTYGVKGLSASLAASTTGTVELTADYGGTPGNGIFLSSSATASWWNDGAATTAQAAFAPGFVHSLTGGINAHVTGGLAAVWYANEGGILLSGTARDGTASAGTCILMDSIGNNKQFKAVVRNTSAARTKVTEFNFDENSDLYIRKVFNTNPTLVNTDITENPKKYWLGETYERFIANNLFRHKNTDGLGVASDAEAVTGSSEGFYGLILGLKGQGAAGGTWSSWKQDHANHKTGWVLSQDIRNIATSDLSDGTETYNPELNTTKLFRFVALQTGEWDQKNVKVSIQDIKAPTDKFNKYGSFSVVFRKADDTDNTPKMVERFSNVNLNPNSVNYIGRRIGDKYVSWDDEENRYIEYGQYDNNSKYVYIEIAEDVHAGVVEPELLPFGFYGHPRFSPVHILSGTAAFTAIPGKTNNNIFVQASGTAGAGVPNQYAHNHGHAIGVASTIEDGGDAIYVGRDFGTSETGFPPYQFTASMAFPSLRLRSSSLDGDVGSPRSAYFGVDYTKGSSAEFDKSNIDVVRAKPAGIDNYDANSTAGTEYAHIFSLDDLAPLKASSQNIAVYVSGSRTAGTSYTALSSSYKGVLSNGYDQFTLNFHGGFDGLDIKESDPFRNRYLTDGTVRTNYAFNSIKRAIDSVKDPEVVDFNLALAPGLTHEGLTNHLINTVEDRADAMAIVDPKGGYEPRTETTESFATRRGSVTTVVNNLNDRGLNTSYACTYYPWVQIRDTIGGQIVWSPPSVVALGTFSSAQRRSDVWFAPAGFTRGGLTEGSAGLPVVGVADRLNSKDRDKLYEANVNPIATFPAEGIVIFGQKTLQITPSALDRINVRRLMIFVKKEISRMAATLLFDQNVAVTWARFTSQVEPFLSGIRAGLGLTDYKVILDETTTTQDLIDRNILYAKIFLKPARAIEYIAIDFTITNSGASFED
jgi:hypothetical protein